LINGVKNISKINKNLKVIWQIFLIHFVISASENPLKKLIKCVFGEK